MAPRHGSISCNHRFQLPPQTNGMSKCFSHRKFFTKNSQNCHFGITDLKPKSTFQRSILRHMFPPFMASKADTTVLMLMASWRVQFQNVQMTCALHRSSYGKKQDGTGTRWNKPMSTTDNSPQVQNSLRRTTSIGFPTKSTTYVRVSNHSETLVS